MVDEGAVTELAEHIVAQIIHDLTDRSAFDDLWDNLHEGVRVEIRTQWVKITRRNLREGLTTLDNGN